MQALTAPSLLFPRSSVFSVSPSLSSSDINLMLIYVRINVGLALFIVSLLVVPLVDVFYVKGRVGFYYGFYVKGRVGFYYGFFFLAVVFCPLSLKQINIVDVVLIFTKAVYTQDASGLQKSANLYFAVTIVIMIICMVFYNIAPRLPVIKYYNELKINAVSEDEEYGPLAGSVWRSTLGKVKWYGFGVMLLFVVTLAIFPGYITEDVHSQFLNDWYPILLITCFNVFDLVGKCLTAVYLLENAKIAIVSCIARLLFFPLFLVCLHGPKFFRTEIPVTVLTCLLGLTNE